QEFGLDRSLLDQWWRYLGGLVRGNLGHSFANRQDVLPLLIERSGRSLLLMLPAIAASTIAGLALARVAARNEGKWQDRLASVVSVAGVSLPSFWLAQLLVLIFAVGLGILPAFGMSSIAPVASGWSRVADIAKHLLLPATCITVFYVAT